MAALRGSFTLRSIEMNISPLEFSYNDWRGFANLCTISGNGSFPRQ
jgi:hypothetical protein